MKSGIVEYLLVDNIDVKHFFMLYSQSKDKLRKGTYCVMFLHLIIQCNLLL